MKITGINSYSPYLINFKEQKTTSPIKFCGLSKDTFEKRAKTSYIPERIPFGIDKSLIKTPKIFLKPQVAKYDKYLLKAAKETAKVSKVLKEGLDKKYGKNNYVFISLGTSPALLGKGLELMGQDVRYVPISNIRCIDPYEVSNKKIEETMGESYIKFLDSIGLNKETINNDKRHYILCDYTASGKSLNTAAYVARNILGIKSDNLEKLSINDFLWGEIGKNSSGLKLKMLIEEYLNFYMAAQVAEDYTSVPHVKYDELENFNLDLEEMHGKSQKSVNFDKALRCYI